MAREIELPGVEELGEFDTNVTYVPGRPIDFSKRV
jgi:hypothetical protein